MGLTSCKCHGVPSYYPQGACEWFVNHIRKWRISFNIFVFYAITAFRTAAECLIDVNKARVCVIVTSTDTDYVRKTLQSSEVSYLGQVIYFVTTFSGKEVIVNIYAVNMLEAGVELEETHNPSAGSFSVGCPAAKEKGVVHNYKVIYPVTLEDFLVTFVVLVGIGECH